MKRYEESTQYRPISAWGYVGYTILFAIPIIGLIFWLVFVFSDKNINRRSFARSYFCWFLLALIVAAFIFGLAAFSVIRYGGLDSIPQIKQKVQDVIGKGNTGSSRERKTEEEEEIAEEPENKRWLHQWMNRKTA